MSHYRNGCTCERCKMRGLMGPAILVTLGVLLLLSELHVVAFAYTWPVLLIVIGVVRILQSNASMEGHVSDYVVYPGYPVAPPATPPAGSNQGQVSNG
jgi:hypothetical protein